MELVAMLEEQEQRLELCEVAVFGGLRRKLEASAAVGVQLAKIRVSGLYQVTGCDSFEAYCRKFLELSRLQVGRILEITEVVEAIRAANLESPLSETQALILAKIPRSRLIACWRGVLERCAREELVLSDAAVRRAARSEIPSEKPSRSVVEAEAEKFRAGVEVTLDFAESQT